jgi:hypothetical protein
MLHLLNKVRSPIQSGNVPSKFGPPNDNNSRVLERRAISLGIVPCSWHCAAASTVSLVNSPIVVGRDPVSSVSLMSIICNSGQFERYAVNGPSRSVYKSDIILKLDSRATLDGNDPVIEFPYNRRTSRFVSLPMLGLMVEENRFNPKDNVSADK